MILILYAHPYPQHSRANRAMLHAANDIPGVRVRSLYDLYPDFQVDVQAEQAALKDAGMVVWQHPMHWYGSPPLFRLWMDKVLQRGWAYGDGHAVLRGKSCLWSVTTGGMADDFAHCGATDLDTLSQPLRSAAELCGMNWLAPYAVHGVHMLDDEALAQAAVDYARRLLDELQAHHVRAGRAPDPALGHVPGHVPGQAASQAAGQILGQPSGQASGQTAGLAPTPVAGQPAIQGAEIADE
jgi:glutathione-regulated potassium-efflux system ancillary protein KefF